MATDVKTQLCNLEEFESKFGPLSKMSTFRSIRTIQYSTESHISASRYFYKVIASD